MLQIILLLLLDVLSTDSEWNVQIPYSICGVRGSNVSIPCNFTYPNNQQLQVTQMLWCSKKQHEKCDTDGPYVYNSAYIHNQSNYKYIGNNISNCCLMISDINSINSGEYLFRFKTNLESGLFTSNHGVDVTIKDLNVSMSRSRDNGSITVGESLNLTCTVSCPGHSPELQWFKDNEPTKNSGPILTLKSVNHKDSGNYSCALKNFKSSESEQISLYVEGTDSVSSDISGSTTYFWKESKNSGDAAEGRKNSTGQHSHTHSSNKSTENRGCAA
ncbi:HEPACAM family member 2-like isoform X2 [Triplophysa rosa]|uniref:HEPACAM family member 2-like isoform X2 n=1 Tax=Triplophysa rosa TaxID=992332 RepID=UPI002545CAEC|nr:HEPACAM family member 2-like isoform X2 [Triplophysa rosa]